MKINYFDLGLYRGEEIEMFLHSIHDLNVKYDIFGFEAHPSYAKSVKLKFENNPNVYIHNFAIGKESKKEKIYISDKTNGQGNSIFSTKAGVSKEYVEVNTISIVEWIKLNVKDFESSFNILRFNIEGAELYLIEDIIKNDFVKYFKLYLGSIPGRDIQRVDEIKHEYDRFINLLQENNIDILPFCKELRNNVNLNKLILAHI